MSKLNKKRVDKLAESIAYYEWAFSDHSDFIDNFIGLSHFATSYSSILGSGSNSIEKQSEGIGKSDKELKGKRYDNFVNKMLSDKKKRENNKLNKKKVILPKKIKEQMTNKALQIKDTDMSPLI